MTNPNSFRIVLGAIPQLLVQVENKGEAVILVVPSRRAQPTLLGVPAAYGASLSLDQSDRGALFVAFSMEIFEIPAISCCSIEKSHLSCESKVFDLSCQKAYLLIACQNQRFSKVKGLHHA